MGWLTAWWRQPDNYDQLGALLQARGMAGRTRAAIAAIGLGLVVAIFTTFFSSTGPRGVVQATFALVAAGGAATGALLWVRRWPTRTQAVCFTLLANASITLAVLSQSEPLGSMLACTTFVTMAGYIALFHAAPLMVYNFVIAACTGVVEAWLMMPKYGFVSAAGAFSLVIMLNLGVPFGIQAVAYVLGIDAMRAEHDQLTGLLNRRAFHRRAKLHLAGGCPTPGHLIVTVIDLDRFKQLNDRFGHSTGDDALVAVAHVLEEHTSDSAVISRVGGEEFVIADIWHPTEVDLRAQRLCDAIAALRFNITASLGTATVGRRVPAALDIPARINELISAADAAMYVAKRRGGNQIYHHDSEYRSDELSA